MHDQKQAWNSAVQIQLWIKIPRLTNQHNMNQCRVFQLVALIMKYGNTTKTSAVLFLQAGEREYNREVQNHVIDS